jgi:hypothetical protein
MGAGGDGGTGGGSFDGYPGYDAEAHFQDVRGGTGVQKDSSPLNDPFEILAQLNSDIERLTAKRIARIVSTAINMHPSVDTSTIEHRARIHVVGELEDWSAAVRKENGTYHD